MRQSFKHHFKTCLNHIDSLYSPYAFLSLYFIRKTCTVSLRLGYLNPAFSSFLIKTPRIIHTLSLTATSRQMRRKHKHRCRCTIHQIIEELDQSYLHPLILYNEHNMSQPGIEPRPPASQAGTLSKIARY